jgi:ATP adenylyltransferase
METFNAFQAYPARRGEHHGHRSKRDTCVFCQIDPTKIIAENDHAFALRDIHPVTALHTLILSRRHVASFFDLSEDEAVAIERLLRSQRQDILTRDPSVGGFNIGINVGEVAGQTIFHCHYHLIPRRKGDVQNPRGGVRWVIPARASEEATGPNT